MNKRLIFVLLLLLMSVGAVSAQGKYKEAPVLDDMVTAGTLPPVDQRLPPTPVVLDPVEEVGTYGGTWHAMDSNDDLGYTSQTVFTDPFLKWNRDANGMRPNLAQTWEWNDDATQLTVHIVQGIKWSDGEPLTVDDYLYWWNDLIGDKDLAMSPPDGTQFNGELMKVDKVDDYTLHFTFPVPNPLFLETQSRGSYYASTHFVPAHYLKQFNPKTNSGGDDHRRFEGSPQLRWKTALPGYAHISGMEGRAVHLRPASGAGTQPVLLESRFGGESTALHRPNRSQDCGSRC